MNEKTPVSGFVDIMEHLSACLDAGVTQMTNLIRIRQETFIRCVSGL